MWKRLEYLEKLLDNSNLEFETNDFIYKRLSIFSEGEVEYYIRFLQNNQLPSLEETFNRLVMDDYRRV